MKTILGLLLMALLGASAYAAQPSDTPDETTTATVADTPSGHECDCLTDEACEETSMTSVRNMAIVSGTEEWAGIYIDGALVDQSHRAEIERLLSDEMAGQAVRLTQRIQVMQEWLNDVAELPTQLADIPPSVISTRQFIRAQSACEETAMGETGEHPGDAKAIVSYCERIGYGRVMQIASDAWRSKDPIGALSVGPCFGQVSGLTFGAAIERLKSGARIARAGQDGVLELCGDGLMFSRSAAGGFDTDPCIGAADMLADDWQVVTS